MELRIRRPDSGYLDTGLWVPKAFINVEGVRRALTFEFFERDTMNVLTLYKETEHHIIVPREFWQPQDFQFPVVDCRPLRYTRTGVVSRIKLDHEFEDGALRPTGKTTQHDAMTALLRSRGGILQLACGIGKTVIALDFIARRGFPALIVLDTTQLIHQWTEEIERHLDIPGGLGRIQGKVFDWKHGVVLATYHTLADLAATLPEEVRQWFGTVVWDEAHHLGPPKFCRSADLFYGMRLGLTATPDRDDGQHVIYNFHLGPVIYKDLRQDLVPDIFFRWTSVGLDMTDKAVAAAVNDCNGEMHVGKVAGYLGRQRARIQFMLDEIQQAVEAGRKVIVLSKSVDCLVNMLAAWNKMQSLITDIPFPTAADVGEVVPPVELEPDAERRMMAHIMATKAALEDPRLTQQKHMELTQKKEHLEQVWQAHLVFKKCEALWNAKRRAYLKDLLAVPSNAGLMIYKVKTAERARMLKEKQVTFAVMKYGREGLDNRALDTIIVNEPISSRNSLQQLMGRVLRKKKGKQKSVVVFLEDNIGPFMGMCQKLRSHLRTWPADEGGPFNYENIGQPTSARMQKKSIQRDVTYARANAIRPPTSTP
jgi:superfamily II DNA or RNA helicase